MLHNTSLNIVFPEKWDYWFKQICELLDIQSNLPIRNQSLRPPFFVFPTKPEISDEDEEAFFATIRNYLFQYGKSRRNIRYLLEHLTIEQSIVFLYGMRYIAFKYGESHRYWPELRRVLFNNEINYQDVAIGLAEITSNMWIRLYEETSGTLYFPKEGPRHIKWPLAHAGLLSDDKNILKEFGNYLIASDIEFFQQVISTELEEFQLTFRDWFLENQSSNLSRLGRLFLGKSSERIVIAELCQQWLKAHSEEFIELAKNNQISLKKKIIPVRRTLFINPENNWVGLRIRIGAIKGKRNIQFKFNGEIYEIPLQYQVSEDKTLPMDLMINLDSPSWNNIAEIVIDELVTKLFLPIVEKNESLVFEVQNGDRTRNWQPNNEYYVLIPNKLFDESKAQTIFSDWIFLNSLKGKWDSYIFLWVRTKNPFIRDPREDSKLPLANLITNTEAIFDEMNLPSFGHQIRAKSRIFGGERISPESIDIPIFRINQPPYFEVEGFWKDDQELILLKQDEISGQYFSLNRKKIKKELSGTHQVIELFGISPKEGLYQISFQKEIFKFGLLDQFHSDKASDEIELDIFIEFVGSDGIRQFNTSKYEICQYDLRITSWPFAGLVLEIFQSDILDSLEIPLQTNENGEWNCSLKDIGLSKFISQSGNVKFRVSWRGFFEKEIIAFDKTFVSSSELKYELKKVNESYLITFAGKVFGPEISKSLIAIFLSSKPWLENQVCTNITLNPKEEFQGESSFNWKPCWIILINKLENNNILAIKEINFDNRNEQSEINLYDVVNEKSNLNWIDLAEEIENAPHPPSLNKYLIITPVLRFFSEIYSKFESLSYWKFYSDWENWPSIRYYLKNGCFLAVFKEKPETGKKAQNIIRDHSIDISLNEKHNKTIEFRFGRGENVPITGIFSKHPILKNNNIRLQSFDFFCRCPTCKVLIPKRDISQHFPPYLDADLCTQMDESCITYEPGDSLNTVIIGVFFDPILQLEAIISKLKKVINGEREFDNEFIYWLKELRSISSEVDDPQEWIIHLVANLEAIIKIFDIGQLYYNDLVGIMNSILSQSGAIHFVISRIEEIAIVK